MTRTLLRWVVVAMVALGAALVSGCGSEDKASTGSSSTGSAEATSSAAGSEELHATVLDEAVANTPPNLDPVSVKLGDNTIKFEEGERLRVAFSGFGKQIPYSIPSYEAAKDLAQELDMEVTEYDPAGDPQAQISQIRSAVASGKFDALVVFPIAPIECDLLTKQAPARGLLVVTIGYPSCAGEYENPNLLTAVAETPMEETFDAWAQKIVEMQGEQPDQKAIVVTGPRTDLYSVWAQDSTRRTFEEAGTEVVNVETDFTEAGSLVKIQAALQSHPDADFLAIQYPEGAAAAETALRIAGKADEVPIYSFGGDEREVAAVEKGLIKMTLPYYPYSVAKTAFQALYLARSGAAEEVPPFIPYAGHAEESIRGAGDEFLFITPENVKAFKEHFVEY